MHDIHRPFAFRSNPGFVFHDSPGFEAGDKKQLQEVLSFIEEKAKSGDVDDQLHAIWLVSLSKYTYWPLIVSSAVKGFASFWTTLGLYCHWKQNSLRRRGLEKVSITRLSSSKITFYSTCHRDFYQIRWSDDPDLWHWSRRQSQSQICGGSSRKKVQKTIVRVYLPTSCRYLLRRQVLVNLEDQVAQFLTIFRYAYSRNR